MPNTQLICPEALPLGPGVVVSGSHVFTVCVNQPGPGYSPEEVFTIAAYNLATGALLGTPFTVELPYPIYGGATGPALSADGSTLFASFGNVIYAVATATGVPRWLFRASGGIHTAPVVNVALGVLHFADDDFNVYALDSGTGALLWTHVLSGQVFTNAALAGGYLFVGSVDGVVSCLVASTGALVWSVYVGGAPGSPSVDSALRVYVGSANATFFCLDGNTGAVLWSAVTDGAIVTQPAIGVGTAYVTTQAGTLFAYADRQPPTIVMTAFPAAGALTPIAGVVRGLPPTAPPTAFQVVLYVRDAYGVNWWIKPFPGVGLELNGAGGFTISGWASTPGTDALVTDFALFVIPTSTAVISSE